MRIVFALIGVLLLAVFLIVLNPTLILNERMLRLGVDLALKKGPQIQWSGARFKSVSEALLRKKLSLHFDRICVDTADKSVHACFSPMDLAATISFGSFIPNIDVVGPIQALNGDVLIDPSMSAPNQEQPGKKGGHLPNWLRDLKTDTLRIEVTDLKVKRTDGLLRGKINLSGMEKADAISLAVLGALNGPDFNTSLSLEALLKARKVLDVDYRISGKYTTGPTEISVAANGSVGAQGMSHVISADLRGLSSDFSRIRIENCHISTRALQTEVNCPVVAAIPNLSAKKWPRVKYPSEARVIVKADLKSNNYPPSPSEPVKGTVNVELEPLQAPLFRGNGRISSKIAGIPARFPRDWKFDTDCDLMFEVPRFSKVVGFLVDTDYAVPAPFNALDGRIELSVKGKLDQERGSWPIGLRTLLSSKTQALNVDSNGTLVLQKPLTGDPKLNAQIDLELQNVVLELPELSVGTPPRIVPDSRIHAPKPSSARKAGFFTYAAKIHTPPESPLRLISNLATAPVPIDIDLSLSSEEPMSGKLGMRNTPVQVFHRNAQIDHFNLTLKAPTDQSDVDGKLLVTYSQYTITVLVLGTVDKTQIKLLSDPPLPEDQIVSVLLFGRSLNDLSPDQSNSVGNTRAAAESGALSLASLYFLASTPIESVTYDPVTGLVSAQVKIAEGTSVSLGASAAGEQALGVSKRIGPHWSITTELDRPASSSSSILSALLQWSNRY